MQPKGDLTAPTSADSGHVFGAGGALTRAVCRPHAARLEGTPEAPLELTRPARHAIRLSLRRGHPWIYGELKEGLAGVYTLIACLNL